MHRFADAFLKMVAAIHEAFIENTVPDPKHVSDLMSHHCHGPVLD